MVTLMPVRFGERRPRRGSFLHVTAHTSHPHPGGTLLLPPNVTILRRNGRERVHVVLHSSATEGAYLLGEIEIGRKSAQN